MERDRLLRIIYPQSRYRVDLSGASAVFFPARCPPNGCASAAPGASDQTDHL